MTERSVEIVHAREVSCHGDDEWGGHPLVYYTLKENNNGVYKAACFYCGKKFIYEEQNDS